MSLLEEEGIYLILVIYNMKDIMKDIIFKLV